MFLLLFTSSLFCLQVFPKESQWNERSLWLTCAVRLNVHGNITESRCWPKQERFLLDWWPHFLRITRALFYYILMRKCDKSRSATGYVLAKELVTLQVCNLWDFKCSEWCHRVESNTLPGELLLGNTTSANIATTQKESEMCYTCTNGDTFRCGTMRRPSPWLPKSRYFRQHIQGSG